MTVQESRMKQNAARSGRLLSGHIHFWPTMEDACRCGAPYQPSRPEVKEDEA